MKQKFDKKEPELIEIDKLFEKAMKKINYQFNDDNHNRHIALGASSCSWHKESLKSGWFIPPSK